MAKKRIAAIDFGLARIGLAISDENQIIAFPFTTIKAEKKLDSTAAKVIKELSGKYVLEEIIIGMPLLLSGKKGFLADEVKSFIESLSKVTEVPIVAWDERLTSVQADRSLRESDMTRKQRAKHVDTVAATILLQSYLDHKSRSSNQYHS